MRNPVPSSTAKCNGYYWLWLSLLSLFSASCVTMDNVSETPDTMPQANQVSEQGFPEWITNPPVGEGMVYGVGSGPDTNEAHLQSILDISFQMSTHIRNSIEQRSSVTGINEKTVVQALNENISQATVTGAKIVDEYQHSDDSIWMLSRMPINCAMDLTQSTLVSYVLELKMDIPEISVLLDDVEAKIAIERMENPVLLAGLFTAKPIPEDFILVEGGTFTMGANDGLGNEKPIHTVAVDSFYIKKTEVTQREWNAVMGNNPSQFQGEDRPVERISWFDAIDYCNALSQIEELLPAYSINGEEVSVNWNANGYRLPTEAEWEYAARGGINSNSYTYSGANAVDDAGWHVGNSGAGTHPVAAKTANELGLFDMSGNVWEWCWDWYGDYSPQDSLNPRGAAEGFRRVLRGGSWYYKEQYHRPASRHNLIPSNSGYDIGLRLVRTRP